MISVIIPCYNAEKTLKRAIYSCLIQQEVLEIIVVDDCSQDGSIALVEKLSKTNPKIKLLQLAKNSGPATARNFGVLNSTQSIIAFLDADDEYLTSAFQIAYNALTQHQHLAAAKLPCEFVDCPIKYTSHPTFANAYETLINTFAGNLVIRREVFFALGLFSQDPILRKHGGEDGILMLALSQNFLVAKVEQEQPSVKIHFHEYSHSQRFFDVCIETNENPNYKKDQDDVWHYSMQNVHQINARLKQLAFAMNSESKGFVPVWKK